MDTKSLSNYITCYEMKSFHRAAKALYITPQGLGKTIDKLEQELQVVLFERTRQGLVPTKAGHYLYERASDLMRQIRSIESEMQRIEAVGNAIRIGVSVGVNNVMDFQKMHGFLEENAAEYRSWAEGFNDEITELLREGELDIALTVGRIDDPVMNNTELFRRPLSLMVYPGHPLYERTEVTFQELRGEPLITLNEKFNTYHTILQRCGESGFVPTIRAKTMESSMIDRLVREKQGLGIDVDIHQRGSDLGDIRWIPIIDSIPWSVNVVCLRAKKEEPQIIRLIDAYRSFVIR